jgi:hypothetical protein
MYSNPRMPRTVTRGTTCPAWGYNSLRMTSLEPLFAANATPWRCFLLRLSDVHRRFGNDKSWSDPRVINRSCHITVRPTQSRNHASQDEYWMTGCAVVIGVCESLNTVDDFTAARIFGKYSKKWDGLRCLCVDRAR